MQRRREPVERNSVVEEAAVIPLLTYDKLRRRRWWLWKIIAMKGTSNQKQAARVAACHRQRERGVVSSGTEKY